MGEFVRDSIDAGQVDVMTIDLDSFDCQVLELLLQKVEASVIVMESQPLIPPPLKFARLYHPRDTLTRGLYGCSLSHQLRLLHPTYSLLLYTETDTYFIKSTLTDRIEAAPPGQLFYWTS